MVFTAQCIKVVQDLQSIWVHVSTRFGIEEIPKHIDSHQIAGAYDAIVVDKPFESAAYQNIFVRVFDTFGIRVTRHDKVEHTTLARREDTGNMLQHQCCVRMKRHDFLQIVITEDGLCSGLRMFFCASCNTRPHSSQTTV